LFKSFSQVDCSTTRQYGGTGLGLAISKKLSELMGGTMWVESEAGRGAAFRFTIDVGVPALPTATPAHPHLAGRRVLVVEDNDTCRDVLARHLRHFGIEPVCVSSIAEADRRLAMKEIFGLALVDLHMAEGSGVAWARQLAREGKRFPLLLLHALGENIVDPAIDGVIHKPIKRDSLGERVAQILMNPSKRKSKAAPPKVDLQGIALDQPLKILLAEDNVVNQTVARHQLAQLGYEVVTVSNGIQAVDATLSGDFDVILMDVQMPEIDGFEATKRIRAAGVSRPWIVALTAGVGSSDRELARAVGMNDYLAKPLRPEALRLALARGYKEIAAGGR
jgi:CheY-like chemotaxis protein